MFIGDGVGCGFQEREPLPTFHRINSAIPTTERRNLLFRMMKHRGRLTNGNQEPHFPQKTREISRPIMVLGMHLPL
jgi:hypothetical protein